MTPLADAVITALLHSLWQNTIIGVLLATVLFALRRRNANTRYVAACGALCGMVSIPLGSATLLYYGERQLELAPVTGTAALLRPAAAPPMPEPPAAVEARRPWPAEWMSQAREWTLPVWIAGVLLCSLRLVISGTHAAKLRRGGSPAEAAVVEAVARLALVVGVTRPIRIVVSSATGSPSTLGWLRPVILVPPATAIGISQGQLEALLAHELAHILRHDYLVNVLQMVVETLLFYHPAVWWASRQIRIERELCCDDAAVIACGDPLGYARALTKLARFRITHAAMAASDGPLLRRIQRVLGQPERVTFSSTWALAVITLAIAGSVALAERAGGTAATEPARLTADLAPQAAAKTPLTPVAPLLQQQTDSTIRGKVMDRQSGAPLVGAEVTLRMRPGGRCCREVTTATGTDGTYEFAALPADEYFLWATATDYLLAYFGQTAGTVQQHGYANISIPLRLRAGEVRASVDIALERGARVTGQVFTDDGDPLPDAEVEFLFKTPSGELITQAALATDADGRFTVVRLAPGEYHLMARVSDDVRPRRGGALAIYVPTFFPGRASLSEARTLVVPPGGEILDLELGMATARPTTVQGRLIISNATGDFSSATVQLVSTRPGYEGEPLSATASPDGRFTFPRVIPGEYVVNVEDTTDELRWMALSRRIVVREDVSGLEIVAVPGGSLFRGRLLTDGGRRLPFDPTDVEITISHRITRRTIRLGVGTLGGLMQPDGTFLIHAPPGPVSVTVSNLPAGWMVSSLRLDGTDVTDAPIEISAGDRQLDVVLTNRNAVLNGSVAGSSAQAGYPRVVLFPEDWARWGAARLVRTVFSQAGTFEIAGLPSGSYRVIALDSMPHDTWRDPRVLERLWPLAAPIRLEEGQQRTVSLTVTPKPPGLLDR